MEISLVRWRFSTGCFLHCLYRQKLSVTMISIRTPHTPDRNTSVFTPIQTEVQCGDPVLFPPSSWSLCTDSSTIMALCVGVLVVNFVSSGEFGDGCFVVLDSTVVDVGLMVETVLGSDLVTALDDFGLVSTSTAIYVYANH